MPVQADGRERAEDHRRQRAHEAQHDAEQERVDGKSCRHQLPYQRSVACGGNDVRGSRVNEPPMMMMSGLRMNSTTSHALALTTRSNGALLAEHAAVQRITATFITSRMNTSVAAHRPVGRERELLVDHRADGRHAIAAQRAGVTNALIVKQNTSSDPGPDARQRQREDDPRITRRSVPEALRRFGEPCGRCSPARRRGEHHQRQRDVDEADRHRDPVAVDRQRREMRPIAFSQLLMIPVSPSSTSHA